MPTEHSDTSEDNAANKFPGGRCDLFNLLGDGSIGIELGVASGDFSRRMVRSGKFRKVFGVDVYGDHHDTSEYISALRFIGVDQDYHLLRMRFDEALALFDDESFDFVYIDGYAHTGEDRGETIFAWLRKVKVGGVLAGHDYHPDWPRVVAAVNELVRATGFKLMVTELSTEPGRLDKHPSWAVIKTDAIAPAPSSELGARLQALEGRAAASGADALSEPFARRLRLAVRLLLGRYGVRILKPLLGRSER